MTNLAFNNPLRGDVSFGYTTGSQQPGSLEV